MAWGKLGFSTLTSAGSDMDIIGMTASKFNQFMIHSLTVGGENKHNFRFDNNSATDYARRRRNNGGTESENENQTQIEYYGGVADDRFEIVYGLNIDGEEKLQIHQLITADGIGVANRPNRAQAVSKCDTTTNSGQYTRIDCFEDVSGQYDTGSNITGLGSEINVIANNFQDGAVYYDKQLNKEYVLNNNAWSEV